jgi:hypothetical protein
LHPYVLAYHVVTPGERTFAVRDFRRRAAARGWRPAGIESLFLYPSGVQRVPTWAERFERRAERLRMVSGGVVLDLVRVGGDGTSRC